MLELKAVRKKQMKAVASELYYLIFIQISLETVETGWLRFVDRLSFDLLLVVQDSEIKKVKIFKLADLHLVKRIRAFTYIHSHQIKPCIYTVNLVRYTQTDKSDFILKWGISMESNFNGWTNDRIQ